MRLTPLQQRPVFEALRPRGLQGQSKKITAAPAAATDAPVTSDPKKPEPMPPKTPAPQPSVHPGVRPGSGAELPPQPSLSQRLANVAGQLCACGRKRREGFKKCGQCLLAATE